jgi:hypothetical protein
MQMAGGWITGTKRVDACGVMTHGSPDWSFQFQKTRQALHLDRTPTRAQLIRYGISHKLNFTPDSCYSYANFSFMILGQVIEQVTGRPLANVWAETALSGNFHLRFTAVPGAPCIHSLVLPYDTRPAGAGLEIA